MTTVWMIGLAFPVALLLGVAYAFARSHPFRYAIAIGATCSMLFWLVAWGLARVAVARLDRTFEVLFLQLALSTVAAFVFAVATMVAAARLRKR